ncbi:MAG: type II toxin-antitoxin system Phd/YefM family antitoxin [Limisphaerales bacterium]
MKAVTVREAQGQLGELIAEACRGELIVISDGDKRVALEPRVPLNLEEDSPELEAELLKAVEGPHKPFSEGQLRELAGRALAKHRALRRK